MSKNWIIMLICGLMAVSCSEKTVIVENALISAQRTGGYDGNVYKVIVTPSENAIAYEYAVAPEDSLSAFESGLLNSTRVEGNAEDTLEIVSENAGATFFARAFNKDNIPGPVFTMRLSLYESGLNAQIQYITDISAGFDIDIPGRILNVHYFIGKEADKQSFLDDEVGSYTDSDITRYVINVFNLEPGTDYVFYMEGVDRGNYTTELYEIPFTTAQEGSVPAVSFEQQTVDAYELSIKFTPNEYCGRFAGYIDAAGVRDFELFNGMAGQGDLMERIPTWATLPMMANYSFSSNAEYVFTQIDTTFTNLGSSKDLYLVAYDKSGIPTGVYYYPLVIRDADNSIPRPGETDIEISSVTYAGCVATVTPGENTMGVAYGSVEAEWYDGISGTVDEYYMHNQLLAGATLGTSLFSYGSDPVQYVETGAEPETRYYIMAAPMNENGPINNAGWGNLAVEEYTTIAEN